MSPAPGPIFWWSAAAATAGTIGGAVTASTWPRSMLFGPVIYRGPADGAQRVALTFDDGPGNESTPRVLDTLAVFGAKAVFFVVGANAARWPALVRRIHDEGHVVANHSFDHSHFGFIRGRRYWERQIDQTDRTIEQIIGVRPALFRPPMGWKTWFVMGAARHAGHTIITWTRRGYDGLKTTPEKIRARLGPLTEPGDILILHDGVEPNSRRNSAATVAALAPVLGDLRQRGFEFVRLDQWLGIPPYADHALICAGTA